MRNLSWILLFFFSSPSVFGTPDAKPAESVETNNRLLWRQVLSVLNRTGPSAEVVSPYTHPLEQDLLSVNGKELAAIEKKWKQLGIETKQPMSKAVRLQKNTYFHNEVEALNLEVLHSLERAVAKSKKASSYRSAARKALDKIAHHPTARPENTYQIKDGDQIGFCFSRALLVHYWLLKEGVPQMDIAKIFVIGDLSVGNVFWQFHVAVIVRDPVDGFVVVDPLQQEVLPYRSWLKINANYDIKAPLSRARFYVTSAQKFLPSFGAYDLEQLQIPHFKKYFDALAPSLKSEP